MSVVGDLREVGVEPEGESRPVPVAVVRAAREPRTQRIAQLLPDRRGEVERVEDRGGAADHGYSGGAIDTKRLSRDVGTKRKGVAANLCRTACGNIEHAVRGHAHVVAGAKKELDVPRLADLHADHIPPACHLAEVERVADGKVHLVGTEERRHARRVAAVVRVEPGAECATGGRVRYCRLTAQRR